MNAYVRRRRERGAYLQLIKHAVGNHAILVSFQLAELGRQCTWTTTLRFNWNIRDLNKLSVIGIRTADSRCRHLVQNGTTLHALTKVARSCYADVASPEAGIEDSCDAPIAPGAHRPKPLVPYTPCPQDLR